MIVLGAVQMAMMIGPQLLAHTPPAIERLLRDDRWLLWFYAPAIALLVVIARIIVIQINYWMRA